MRRDHWQRLREIAAHGVDLRPRVAHEVYEERIAQKHWRQPAFWVQVKDERGGACGGVFDHTVQADATRGPVASRG